MAVKASETDSESVPSRLNRGQAVKLITYLQYVFGPVMAEY
jgi:hypothetical protein